MWLVDRCNHGLRVAPPTAISLCYLWAETDWYLLFDYLFWFVFHYFTLLYFIFLITVCLYSEVNYKIYGLNTYSDSDEPIKSNYETLVRPQLYALGYPRQPSPRATLGEFTFHCVVQNVKQLFIWMSPSCLGGRDSSGGRIVSPRQVG